jgi:GTP cyclohydrolase II
MRGLAKVKSSKAVRKYFLSAQEHMEFNNEINWKGDERNISVIAMCLEYFGC